MLCGMASVVWYLLTAFLRCDGRALGRAAAAAVVVVVMLEPAEAQSSRPQSYADLYSQRARETQRPRASARAYTYDRYFKDRPTLSPYLQLLRRSSAGETAYQSHVRPELQRRAAQRQPPRTSRQKKSTAARVPDRTGAAITLYHSHYYSRPNQSR